MLLSEILIMAAPDRKSLPVALKQNFFKILLPPFRKKEQWRKILRLQKILKVGSSFKFLNRIR